MDDASPASYDELMTSTVKGYCHIPALA